MSEHIEVSRPRVPWNKGKLIGAKPPLRSKHVWSIRTRLQVEGRTRDLAMFNLAIDSKLCGCDVIAIRVDDVAPHGYTADRATVRQRKTGRPVRFELTEQTPAGHRRLHPRRKQEIWRVSVRRAAGPGAMHDDAAIRSPRQRVDCRHRARSTEVWYQFASPHESDSHLSPHGESSCCTTVARPFEDRKHRALPWHRGRRCPGNS
jgi:hypothetical protein